MNISCKKHIPGISMIALMITLIYISCSNSTDSDSIPPAPIGNLAVIDSNVGTITLNWTASGDDSLSGIASAYDLRFSSYVLNESNWNSAIQADGEPDPGNPGSVETIQITGLAVDSTYYFALKVRDDAHNWSAISNVVSALPDLMAEISDENLEAAIRSLLDKQTGEILASELLTIDSLDAAQNQISDISGLEHCLNMRYLRLHTNQISDLSPLTGLTKIDRLALYTNQITDINPLAGMTSLELLYLGWNQIEDITILENMPFLRSLALDGNEISDLSALADLNHIDNLVLSYNNIENISPLVNNSGLGEGDELWLEFNPLSEQALTEQIPVLTARGVTVIH